MLGRTLGSYRVVRKIGQGGMGAVYEAVHTTLGRRAAVKVLLQRMHGQSEAARRFFTEAKAISMVTHPCLVTIFEHGTSPSPDDQPFIVMEYLEGETLRARAEKHYLGGSALLILRQLASALSATHKKRIVHRDLKPDNVMLVRDDTVEGGLRAKILDFGIAKLLPDAIGEEGGGKEGDKGSASLGVRTRTGALIGTPAYMSPEQCRAATAPDEKTDVYSLGIILYELLYGEAPFVSDAAGELYAMHMFAPPPSLTARVPALNAKLAAVVQRMLAKKPAERPSMDELLAEVQTLTSTGLSDGPASARPCLHQPKSDGAGSPLEIASTSAFIRRQMASPNTQTGSASRGEQVVPAPLKKSGARTWLLGSGLALILLGGVGLTVMRRSQTAGPRTKAVTLLPTPVLGPSPAQPPPTPTAPPTPTPPAAPKSATPDGGAEPTPTAGPGDATAGTPAPHGKALSSRKDKALKKAVNGPKADKHDGNHPTGKYQVDLWK